MSKELTGNLLEDFDSFLESNICLVVMPISRLTIDSLPKFYPPAIVFYPEGYVNLDDLYIKINYFNSNSIAEMASIASRINQEILGYHPLIVFPIRTSWSIFVNCGHTEHMEFIRTLSEYVDRSCLNFIRYKQCPIEPIDSLPGRAGMVNSNSMMSGALLYNYSLKESRIIGGAAFTHTITRGVGLPLDSINFNLFPKDGEVGNIVNHALSLYTELLEANSATSRFVQALSLLEFLAFPDEYKNFQDVKKIVARYIAKNKSEYETLLDRFFEMTGKKDDTNKMIGYRTRIVHMGESIENIFQSSNERKSLFLELQSYIKAVIDHMIEHSDKSWVEYLTIREQLRAFEN